MAAIKPPMYTVALTPITVGTAAAYADTAHLHLPTFALFLAAAVFIIAWLNLTNDVFDFDTGIDRHKRESVVNLCGATPRARNAILAVATVLLAAAFAALAAISRAPRDLTVVAVVGLAVCGGYAYQGPPFRLGYLGLGEPICFLTWALAVAAAYYSQLRLDPRMRALLPAPPALSANLRFLLVDTLFSPRRNLCAAALLVAAPTATILFCSHFHQLNDDRLAGKRSPIVRLGTGPAARVLQVLLVAFFALEAILFARGMLPVYPFSLSLLSLPYAVELARFVSRTHSVPPVVRAAKYYAVKFHFVHGMLLTLGYFLTAQGSVASW